MFLLHYFFFFCCNFIVAEDSESHTNEDDDGAKDKDEVGTFNEVENGEGEDTSHLSLQGGGASNIPLVPVNTKDGVILIPVPHAVASQLKPDLLDSSKESLHGTSEGHDSSNVELYGTSDGKKRRLFTHKSESCSMCGKMFHRIGDRKRHEASCLRSPYRCHYCIKCFSSENEWYEHEKRHTEGPIHRCTVCGKVMINQRTWRQHMRLKHPVELKEMEETACIAKCQHCDKSFNSYRSLGDHMEQSHSDMLSKVLSHLCQYCQRSFSSSFGLLTHQIAAHPKEKAENETEPPKKRKKSQCHECGKVMVNIKYHERIHTGERPYPCDVCKKTFASPQNLKQHMRTHTGEKPYKCRYCASSFTTSGSRIRHERIHTGDKPFNCQCCAKAFNSRAQLTVHLRSHTGETPYQCPECNRKFCYKNTLDRHIKTHNK